jgi:hypothetical protein
MAALPDEMPGLQLPDVVSAGEHFDVSLRNVDPGQVSCVVRDVSSGEIEDVIVLTAHELGAAGRTRLAEPGIYRIEVDGHGYSTLEQLVMAAPPSASYE